MYRGGNWNNGTNAGVFYLNGNNSRSNSNTNIGFRSALALFAYVLRARLCRSTKAKGTHFPADKAKDERSRSSPVNYWGRRANRAGWPFLLYAGEGRPRSCGVAAVGKRPFQGVSHAGLFIKTWKE